MSEPGPVKWPRLIETEEEEVARLARFPQGSTWHELSKLPVLINEPEVRHLLIELPVANSDGHRMVVVPTVGSRATPVEGEENKLQRYGTHWECAIVASDHPRYPVQGYRISVPEAQLRRGRRLSI
ncbi:hypothetical protein [Nesterenkonia rhizosphaerae]|uniref:Uncharacterized protein n=1 Tax=Nesterenkonia rhizosphaerae TaxID=1348272 RepID=A0ABP9G3J4_9MICC